MHIDIDSTLILAPINKDNVVGEDLTYLEIYDEIKEARINEDDNVSRGVWERDLKKSDWKKVVRLSYDVLCNKSKDLQVLGWLCEGLVVEDGLEGLVIALDVLHDFLQEYWVDCYPADEDNGFDYVYKTNILQWIANTLNRKISEARIFKDSDITIDVYEYSFSIDQKIKQYPDHSNSIIESAIQNGYISLDDFKDEFSKKITSCIDEYKSLINDCKNGIQKLNNFVDSIRNSDVYFGDLLGKLEKLESFLVFGANTEHKEHRAKQESKINKNVNKLQDTDDTVVSLWGDSDASRDDHTASEKKKDSAPPVENKSINDDFVVLPYGGDDGSEENEKFDTNTGDNDDSTKRQSGSLDREEIYGQLRDIADRLRKIDPHSPSHYFIKLVSGWKNKTLADIILDVKDGDRDILAVLKIFSGL